MTSEDIIRIRGRRMTAERMCGNKHGYKSRKDAKNAAKHAQRRYGCGKLRTYRCPICDFWHLTSQEKEE